jgi:hypothetical protein
MENSHTGSFLLCSRWALSTEETLLDFDLVYFPVNKTRNKEAGAFSHHNLVGAKIF